METSVIADAEREISMVTSVTADAEREISMVTSVIAEAERINAMETANDEKPASVGDREEAESASASDVATVESQKKKIKKKTRIRVSSTKRPFLFYCNLAKRYIKQYNSVELSALGMAIPTLITIAETLKSKGLAVEKQISTSTVITKLNGEDGRIVRKPQIAILLGKAEEVVETPVPVVAAA